jgi:hypothetical protein
MKRIAPSSTSLTTCPSRDEPSLTTAAIRRIDASLDASAQMREPIRPEAPTTMMDVDESLMDLHSGTL